MAKLSDFFRGYDKHHGVFEVGSARSGPKVEGKAYTVASPADDAAWETHLKGGRQGVGIIPLLDDNTLYWGGIDVDQYNIQLPNLSLRIENYPLTLFRSKSGGAHLICFVREPVPAASIVKFLRQLAAALGFPKDTEIFPKQVTRGVDKEGNLDVGNWLNMPYHGGDRSSRYAIVKGKALSLDECVSHLETKALTADEFFEAAGAAPEIEGDDPFDQEVGNASDLDEESQMLIEDEEPAPDPEPKPRPRPRLVPKDEPPEENVEDIAFADGPPCLQTLHKRGGFPDSRNNGMFNVAVYLAKKYPSSWQERVNEYNDMMCKPPLRQNELAKTVERSNSKKEYSYKCTDAPINSVCQRPICLARKFGVGITQGKISEFTLVKHDAEPITWDVLFVGKSEPMHLSSDELYSQTAFGKKTMNFMNVVLQTMPENRWRGLLNDKVKAAEILQPKEDEESNVGEFKTLLEKFCVGRAQATSWDDIQSDHVYTADGMSWFRGRALLSYLKDNKFRFENNREIWFLLQQRGGMRDKKIIKGMEINVWGIPEFKRTDSEKELPDSLKDFEKGGNEPF